MEVRHNILKEKRNICRSWQDSQKSVKRGIQGKEVGRIQKIGKVGHLSRVFSGKSSCGLL